MFSVKSNLSHFVQKIDTWRKNFWQICFFRSFYIPESENKARTEAGNLPVSRYERD